MFRFTYVADARRANHYQWLNLLWCFWLSLQLPRNEEFLVMQTGQPGRLVTADRFARDQISREISSFYTVFFVLFYFDGIVYQNWFSFERGDHNFCFLLFLLSPYSCRGTRQVGERQREKPVLSLPPVFRVRVDEHWATMGCVVKHDMGGISNGSPFFLLFLFYCHLNEFNMHTQLVRWSFPISLSSPVYTLWPKLYTAVRKRV